MKIYQSFGVWRSAIPKFLIYQEKIRNVRNISKQLSNVIQMDDTYIVNLPIKLYARILGNSGDQAMRRFDYLEKKFVRQPDMHLNYRNFIHEYLNLDHMEPVPEEEMNNYSYYLPHHPFFRPLSTTTKLRVVFDALVNQQVEPH